MHASAVEIFNLVCDTDLAKIFKESFCWKVVDACDIYEWAGKPVPKKNLSQTHVHEALNQWLQEDF